MELNRARRDVSGVDKKREGASTGTKHAGDHRRIAYSPAPSNGFSSKPLLVTWAESFVFAGSSVLLLLVVNLFPQYWYVSFFALTPFLYRIIKASPGESLRLGFLFGICFFGVSIIDSQLGYPFSSFLKLLAGTGLFALFGWIVGWARQRWGFNPAFVALLWVALEIGLVKLGIVGDSASLTTLSLSKGGLLGEAELSHPFFGGLFALFGFLSVSAIVVLLNSLLVLLVLKTLALKIPRGKTVQEDERRTDLFSAPWFFTQRVYLVPEGRAPPYIITGVSSHQSLRLQLDLGNAKGLHSSFGKAETWKANR